MRVTIGVVATGLLCLFGGGIVATAASSPQMANATNAVEPPDDTNAMATAEPESRASQIEECVSEPPVHLPDGANANLICSCAVDRMASSEVTRSDAILQCAVQQRVAVTELRASEIGGCTSGASDHLPDGTDANAFCTCAVDKMLTRGTPQLDAVNQCAAEMRITLRNMD